MGVIRFESRLSQAVIACLCAISPAVLSAATVRVNSAAHVDAAGRLQIDVHFDCSLAAPVAALSAAGLSASSAVHAGTLCVVEGWTLPATLPQIADVPGVTRVTAPNYLLPTPPRALRPLLHGVARASAPQQISGSGTAIDHNGVSIMRADQFLAQTGLNGAGVTVGVQSSGVASLATIQARGELPAVQVVYPAGNQSSVAADEGTALMEEIHAVAPGAKLVYCGPSTFVDFTSCMTQLINAGATVLVDDTGFSSDGLMSQNNDNSSAVAQILAQNPAVMMMSSAGNNEGTYWEGNYFPVSVAATTLPTLSCPASSGPPDNYVAAFGTATSETLTITGNYNSFPLLLAWADPPGQISHRFEIYLFAAGGTEPLGCFSTAGATTDQFMQTLDLPNGTYSLVVASQDASASGEFMKLWAGGDGLTAFSVATSGGLISPQDAVPGLITVGAVNGSDGIGDSIEAFSSTGPLTVMFPTPASLQAPFLVAPDGINVDANGTYFAADLFPDGNFYGTSASVANAGGVAALLRGAFPTLNVSAISNAMESGATVLGATAPDYVFGYGRIDALGALATVPAPTITALTDESSTASNSSATQAFSVTGTGPLHFAVLSNNTALVPSSVVAAGSPGVTLSAGCGASTLNCTVFVTPVTGQAGMATVTLSVLDAASRSAATQMTLTATDPASAPTSAAGSGSASGGGGALQGWVLLWLGVLLAYAQHQSRKVRRVRL